MIAPITLDKAGQIAGQLAAKEIRLSTVEGSPLDALLEHTAPTTETQYAQEAAEVVAGIANSDDLRGTLHDECMTDTVNALAEGLTAQIKFAREVVNPQVNEVFAAVKAEAESLAQDEYVVVELEPREIYSSQTLHELLKPHASHTGEAQLFSGFPVKDAAAITECLTTGSASFDTEIAGLVAARDTVWLESVYNKYFVNGNTPLNTATASRSLADEYIIVTVLARNLIDEPVAGLDMSFPQYQQRMSAVLAVSAFLANAAIQSFQLLEQNGVLVLTYPVTTRSAGVAGGGEIQVYGPVYREFLANGGSVDAVIGSALGQQYTYVTDVLSNKDALEQKAAAHAQVTHEKHEGAVGARIKARIGTEVSRLIAAADVSTLSGNESHEKAHERVTEYLTHYSDYDVLKDLYAVIRRVLVNSMYPASNAVQLLETMTAIETKDPSLTVRDVAYYAIVELVAEYLAQQIGYVQL